jgi:hypothetical protein
MDCQAAAPRQAGISATDPSNLALGCPQYALRSRQPTPAGQEACHSVARTAGRLEFVSRRAARGLATSSPYSRGTGPASATRVNGSPSRSEVLPRMECCARSTLLPPRVGGRAGPPPCRRRPDQRTREALRVRHYRVRFSNQSRASLGHAAGHMSESAAGVGGVARPGVGLPALHRLPLPVRPCSGPRGRFRSTRVLSAAPKATRLPGGGRATFLSSHA